MKSELLGTQKLIVAYVLKDSGRGQNKCKKKCLNFVRLYFPYEEMGTILYARNEGDIVVLSKNVITVNTVEVKRHGSTQRYINARDIFNIDKLYYRVEKRNEEYFFIPIPEESVEDFTSQKRKRGEDGFLKTNGYISICKKTFEKFSKESKYFHIHFYMDDYPHIEVERCDSMNEEETLVSKYSNPNTRYNLKEMHYKVAAKPAIYIPVSYFKNMNMNFKKQYHTYLENEKLIIELDPVYCDICHKPIRRYKENSKIIYRCKSCSSALSKFEGFEREDRFTLISKLLKYEKELDNIMDSLYAKVKEIG